MKIFLSQIFFLLPFFSFSQNLLVNGGFEDENICTEFHVNCAPEGWISTADTYNNFFKIPAMAHNGQHCVAIQAGHSRIVFMRTYIRSQLLCRLRKGKKYRIEFYARSRHDILDSIGIYFTGYDFLFEKKPHHEIDPALYVADAEQKPVKKDTSWQKFSLEYLATGNELYITLGNFSKRDITGETGVPLENHFFIFFDDVSLTPLDPNEKICDDWQRTKDEIYEFDPRHQILGRYIKTYFKNPPEPPEISRTVVQSIDTLVLPDILFESGKATLTNSSHVLLDSLCSRSAGKRIDSLVVEGHTDSTGTTAFNQKLGQDRARSAANYIAQKLFLPSQLITTRGWGSERAVADNRTPAGRQLNRRVEIFIYIRE